MNCYKHGSEPSVSRCMACSQHICADCTVNIDSSYYCKDCVSEMASREWRSGLSQQLPPQGQHGHTPPQYIRPGVDRRGEKGSPSCARTWGGDFYYDHGPVRRYRKSAFLLFIFSAVPGLNYMYLGLMKRGLFFMTLFFIAIFASHELGIRLLMFAVFILMCYSLFDGFRARRLLMDGFVVPDASDDIIAFFKRHKAAVIILVLVAIFTGLAGRAGRLAAGVASAPFALSRGMLSGAHDFISFGAALLVIVAGCYIAAKLISKIGKNED